MFGELTRWNPAKELSSWHKEIDGLFRHFFEGSEDSGASWKPHIETYRKDNDYVMRVDLPGVDPKDVHINVEGNLLSITGERKQQENGRGYSETFYGRFERQLALPQGAEADKIAARYEHGVLEITVPLPAQLAGRQIPIQIEQANNENKRLESKAA